MTRAEMQAEAMVIASLLNSVMALYSRPDNGDAIRLVEMAFDRADRLNAALDIVNAPEVAT